MQDRLQESLRPCQELGICLSEMRRDLNPGLSLVQLAGSERRNHPLAEGNDVILNLRDV